MSYVPKVNDYVKWKDVEGWVYFMDSSYLTIEVGVKCKNAEDIVNCPIHKKTHILVVCYPNHWNELKYIKTRNNIYDQK